jgi:hypothetical protein
VNEFDWKVLALAIVAVALVFQLQRYLYHRGRLRGIQDTLFEITRGISHHYEVEGQPIPQEVAKAVDDMKARVKKAEIFEKCKAYTIHMWHMGNAMGAATSQAGFEAGQRSTDPRDGEVRIDLTAKELRNIRFMAHYGFENMMVKGDLLIEFENEQDANAATEAIVKLEHKISRNPDDKEPYALAFNRQTMIWDRWPPKDNPPEPAPTPTP